jgi:2-amino-4-hydroxy-6-hydroxymethyldihydropteridine diphosphokinase
MPEVGPTTTLVGLGSNVDPERHLPLAVALLADRLPLRGVSSAWATVAVGPPGQRPFLNAGVLVDAEDPTALKTLLREIEASLGRVRTSDRYAPRSIDLDLLLRGPGHTRVDGVDLPDPDLLVEPHLAIPAAELLPGWVHPDSGETLAEIARRLAGSRDGALLPRRLTLRLTPPRRG